MRYTKSAKHETGRCTAGKEKRKWKLPPLKPWRRALLYLSGSMAAAAAILQAARAPLPQAAGYPVYAAAFLLLCGTAVYLQQDVRRLGKKMLFSLIASHPLIGKAYRDYGYRTMLTAGFGTAVNLAFTVCNGVWGIWNRSVWFIAMAVYYSLLGGMRFFSVSSKRRADLEPDREAAFQKEMAVMKRDGMILLLVTGALGAIIFLKIVRNAVTPYSTVLAIATAAYTFYKIIFAVWNMRKVRKLGSPILTAIRNVAFADALVSLFSLQVLMFVSFESKESGSYDKLMNSVTGMAVCLSVVILGLRMVFAPENGKNG